METAESWMTRLKQAGFTTSPKLSMILPEQSSDPHIGMVYKKDYLAIEVDQNPIVAVLSVC